MTEKPPTSFRLSQECRDLIRQVGQALGIKDSAVVEIAVRRLAASELQIQVAPAKPKRKDKPK